MLNSLKEFSYEGKQLRTVTNESNETMFCLKDVCNILGLSNVTWVKERLREKGFSSTKVLTDGGMQEMIFIDEPNLYRCIMQSRKEEAVQFQDWVFEEVLPTLRKDGMYAVGEKQMSEEEMTLFVISSLQKKIEEKNKQLEQAQQKLIDAQPAIDYYARSTASVGSTTINMWAKNNGLKPLKVYEALRNHKYIGSVGRQHNIANSTVCKKGIFEVIRSILPNGRVNYTSYVMEDKAAHLLEVITKWEEYPFLINCK